MICFTDSWPSRMVKQLSVLPAQPRRLFHSSAGACQDTLCPVTCLYPGVVLSSQGE